MTAPLHFVTEGRPTFPCQESRGQLWFTCPTCGKRNLHGTGEGHRVAHCTCWPGGYFLVKDRAGGPNG